MPDKEFLEYKPPENHAPVVSPIQDQTALVGDLIGITPSATDQDGDTLGFTITGWMTETTKVALSSDVGARTVTVTASDGISTSSISFTVSIGNYAWAGIAPTVGFSQPNLSGHSAIFDYINKRMVVFGGFVQGVGVYLNWITVLSLWSEGYEYWWDLNPWSCSTLPLKRAQHTSIFDSNNQRMILFGGENTTSLYFNDVWELSFTETTEGKWCPLSISGTKPFARAMHSAIFDPINNRMIIFGGSNFTTTPNPECPANEPNCTLGDLWALNITTLTWQEIFPPQPRPSPRKGHSAIYDPDRKQMIVFGGRACPTTCDEVNDVWALDLSSAGDEKWKQLAPESSPPDPREGAAGVYIPGSGKVFFVGGNAGSSKFGDVWFLNLGRPTWGRVYPDGGTFTARTSYTIIFDSYNSRLIVFGGLDINGQGLNDTWSLQ